MEDSDDQAAKQGNTLGVESDLSIGPLNTRQKQRKLRDRAFKRKLIYIFAGILVVALLAVISMLVYTRDNHLIADGITISGISVGNLTQDQARSVIDKQIQQLVSQSLRLDVGQQALDVKLEDLGLSLSAETQLEDAYAYGRTGSLQNKIATKIASAKGVSFNLTPKWDDQKMKDQLNTLLDKFSSPATDATFEILSQNTMTIHKEHSGLAFDSEALIASIKAIDIFKPVSDIKVDLKEQLPKITAAQLEDQKITGLLASFTTRFDPSQTARSENVRIAAKALDMSVIKPGDTLSFNKLVGERTVEAGYKDAYIIVNGQFVPGLAGGICQVSTTLYNTGLLANLSVAQRSNHDLAISYAPLGQDATVAYPDLDLKFTNNSGGYLLVRTWITSNTLTIELYGKVKPGQEVLISDTTESIIPPPEQHLVDETLAHGAKVLKQQGQPGYIVNSVRTVKINGKVVSTEPLRSSHYVPLPKIYEVGP